MQSRFWILHVVGILLQLIKKLENRLAVILSIAMSASLIVVILHATHLENIGANLNVSNQKLTGQKCLLTHRFWLGILNVVIGLIDILQNMKTDKCMRGAMVVHHGARCTVMKIIHHGNTQNRQRRAMDNILDYLASMGGNPEWSLSYLRWQQLRGEIQISGSRAELQENKGGDAVGEDDKGKTESVSE